ncbi:hypothetical protein JCM6882_004002 [Rhodosporidiobolus microsporus]
MPDDAGRYDYRSSSIDEDRKRAQEVWDRAEQRERERDGAKEQRQRAREDDRRQDAAKSIQGRFRAHVSHRESLGRNLTLPSSSSRRQAQRQIQHDSQQQQHQQQREGEDQPPQRPDNPRSDSSQRRNMTGSERWTDGMRQRRLSAAGREQKEGQNDAASRWQRAEVYMGQISQGSSAAAQRHREGEISAEEEMDLLGRNDKEKKKIQRERVEAKQMESQYWLEMVDKKHRYGSNLKYYHAKWNEEDTKENFFHWLDEGGGKDFDLEQCPRKRLESERITYLTAEEREQYRVVVDTDSGLLVWAKDGSPLDTSKYHEDRGPGGGGIVEISEEEYREKERQAKERLREKRANGGESPELSSDSDSSSSSSSSDEAQEIREGTQPYGDKGGTAGQGKGVRQFKQRVKFYTSPQALMDHMLRHSALMKNTWLYVSDLKNNLYVGIKKTGQFQHSSLLYGARVTSAGLIKASKGHLTSLSPLSGHYRAGTQHFKAFIRSLKEQGIDMNHVAISKSVLTIRGIEKYGRFTKKKKDLTSRLKSGLTGNPPPSEQDADTDAKNQERIESEERDEGAEAHEREVEEGEEGLRERKEGGGDGKGRGEGKGKPLPGEGKKPEEMTEEERMERGVMLVQRAFERGLKIRDVDEGEERGGAREEQQSREVGEEQGEKEAKARSEQ